MKPAFLLFVLTALLSFNTAHGAPPAPVVDPPDLVKLREAYAAALTPIHARIDAATKQRSSQYAGDLKKIEDQATAAGRFEVVPVLRAEREAYAAGGSTDGFPKNEKNVPATALNLRRTFDHDLDQTRLNISAEGRPVIEKYLRQLDELERTFVAAKAVDEILAVRRERQCVRNLGFDVFGTPDTLVIGKWMDDKGKEVEFLPGGGIKDGHWLWADRARRAVRVNWKAGAQYFLKLTVSADGMELTGVNATGDPKHFIRKFQ